MKRVYKYNLKWQLVRAKNKKVKFIDKLNNVKNFLYNNPSIENKERVINYLKGLYLGYKTVKEKAIINDLISILKNYEPTKIDTDISVKEASTQDLLILYKDLYLRNQKWLSNNYRNIELNDFLKILYKELIKREQNVDKNYNIYPKGPCKQKFIY